MNRRLRALGLRLGLTLAAVLAADQIVQWTLLRDGYLLDRRIAPFDPPIFTAGQRATLDRLARGDSALGDVVFDRRLGWCTPPAGSHPAIDWCGGRAGREPVPEARRDGVRRVAVFGCSFTYGSEVDGPDSWPARLDALRDDLEVLNLGVPGYGPDQALLRMRRDIDRANADEVWLGLLPATALRLVSIYRPALRHYTNTVACKPRFRLRGTELELVPNPATSVTDLAALVEDPRRFEHVVSADSFMARSRAAYARDGSDPAHWFATSRLFVSFLERDGRDWAARFRDRDDETRRLLAAIVEEFRRECDARGLGFRLLILPDRDSLRPARLDGAPAWAEFAAELTNEVDVADLTRALEDAGGSAAAELWAPNGHDSSRGNDVVAREL